MEMEQLIARWRRAAERADEEQVRVMKLGDEYRAASSSTPLASYALRLTDAGWSCECEANAVHGVPCKHLAALADLLDLDVLSDIAVAPELNGTR